MLRLTAGVVLYHLSLEFRPPRSERSRIRPVDPTSPASSASKPRGSAVGPVLLAAAVSGATSLRILQLGALSDQGVFAKYLVFAREILAGRLPVERLADLSPGYLWLVVGLLGPLRLGPDDILKLQLVMVGLAALMVGLLCRRLAGPVAGWTAAAALVGAKGAWLNATELEPETLVLVLDTAALALLLRPPRTALRDGAAGLLLGLSAVTRPTALALGASLVLWRTCTASAGPEGCSRPRRLLARLPLALIVGVVMPVAAFRIVSAPLPRAAAPMNPGTVLYEGWNPTATGYLGEAPRVVKDLERSLAEPDALHVAYRRIAEAAGASSSNRFWSGLAIASVVELPGRAASLAVAKAGYVLHSYEAWDLATLVRRNRLAGGWSWLPFGLLAAVAALGGFLGRPRPAVAALILWSASASAVMVVFYVTSRQRNPLVPAVAILCGLGLDALVRLWRDRRRALAAGAAAAAVMGSVVLVVPGHAQREDDHAWRTTLEVQQAVDHASQADHDGAASRWWVESALRLGPYPDAFPRSVVRDAVEDRLRGELTSAERFDTAVAATRCGGWTIADRVLAGLDAAGYVARRGSEVAGSPAYHRARCRLHLGDGEGAEALVTRSLDQTPGDPWAAALACELARRSGAAPAAARLEALLDRVADPFTARLARARALADLGQLEAAQAVLEELAAGLPEWNGPRRESRTW